MPFFPDSAGRVLGTQAGLDRRVVLKAAAALGAMAVAPISNRPTSAQSDAETMEGTFVVGDNIGAMNEGNSGTLAFEADFTFYAVGAHWNGDTGTWPRLQMRFSNDGKEYGEPVVVGPSVEDAGQPDRDGRIFSELAFTNGARFLEFQSLDEGLNPIEGGVGGLTFTYLDATAGPTLDQVYAAALQPSIEQPPIITRAEWGANEKYRYNRKGELWPPQWERVRHVIIHHTETANFQDPVVAMRSIYYYHAKTRGWGDIGYNYLVDYLGNVYEGRYGGENTIGGHAYQYAIGSAGIGTIGNFNKQALTAEAQAGLVWIVAWAARNLDPNGRADFHETPNLPTICAHRDVNQTECPGDMLYEDIVTIRDYVTSVLQGVDPSPGEELLFNVGDAVQVTVVGGNLRGDPGLSANVAAEMDSGTKLTVVGGPVNRDGYAWYQVEGRYGTGWSASSILAEATQSDPEPEPEPTGLYRGDWVAVDTDALNLREAPGKGGQVLTVLATGTQASVIGGPRQANGMAWVKIDVAGLQGWAVAQYLKKVGQPAPDRSGRFKAGDNVFVDTDALNIRRRAGLAHEVVTTLLTGAQATVLAGPNRKDGYRWYKVSSDGVAGWAVEEFLSPLNTPTRPSGDLTVGDRVTVTTDAVNIRARPSTDAPVLGTAPSGVELEVTAPAERSEGRTWIGVYAPGYGGGWAVEEYLTGAGRAVLEVGVTARAFDGELNMRDDPGLRANVIRVVPDGSIFQITGGPVSRNGHRWYRVTSEDYGQGWLSGTYLEVV